jgi:hypothetical protein
MSFVGIVTGMSAEVFNGFLQSFRANVVVRTPLVTDRLFQGSFKFLTHQSSDNSTGLRRPVLGNVKHVPAATKAHWLVAHRHTGSKIISKFSFYFFKIREAGQKEINKHIIRQIKQMFTQLNKHENEHR